MPGVAGPWPGAVGFAVEQGFEAPQFARVADQEAPWIEGAEECDPLELRWWLGPEVVHGDLDV